MKKWQINWDIELRIALGRSEILSRVIYSKSIILIHFFRLAAFVVAQFIAPLTLISKTAIGLPTHCCFTIQLNLFHITRHSNLHRFPFSIQIL